VIGVAGSSVVGRPSSSTSGIAGGRLGWVEVDAWLVSIAVSARWRRITGGGAASSSDEESAAGISWVWVWEISSSLPFRERVRQ
jgi:hypothetical protein